MEVFSLSLYVVFGFGLFVLFA